jgi:hypothetical protein
LLGDARTNEFRQTERLPSNVAMGNHSLISFVSSAVKESITDEHSIIREVLDCQQVSPDQRALLRQIINLHLVPSITVSKRTTMCLILHYDYACHPSASETVVRRCHYEIQDAANGPSDDLSYKKCPRLWTKRISPPMCPGCLMT